MVRRGHVAFLVCLAAFLLTLCSRTCHAWIASGPSGYVVSDNVLVHGSISVVSTSEVSGASAQTVDLYALIQQVQHQLLEATSALVALRTVVSAQATVPAGSVVAFAGPLPPTGYLACNGAAVDRVVFASLFAAIGTTYGAGDGNTTFDLPNMQGVFLRGAGSQVIGAKSYTAALGAYVQDSTAVNGLQDTGHYHQQEVTAAASGNGFSVQGSQGTTTQAFVASVYTAPASAAMAGDAETAPAHGVVLYIIKS